MNHRYHTLDQLFSLEFMSVLREAAGTGMRGITPELADAVAAASQEHYFGVRFRRRYSVILADPPWLYRDERRRRGGAVAHYPVMTDEQILKLPVHTLAADNCMLFLWVTWPRLELGLEVMRAWGFEYRTVAFDYVKLNRDGSPFMGIGSYTRANSEPCLLGIRGKGWRLSRSVRSVVLAPREDHSKKPDQVRQRIVELCGDVPRIELFAREAAEGWDHWGNEIDGSCHREAV